MRKSLLLVTLLYLFGSSQVFAHAVVMSSSAHVFEHLVTAAFVVAMGLLVIGFVVRNRRVRNSS